jgi:signal transduction histidine kinase
VSHQIRTPLTSILGHAELISDSVAGPSAAGRAAVAIQHAAHRLEAVAVRLCEQVEARGTSYRTRE